MSDEFYIVEGPPARQVDLGGVTEMRIVEVGHEMVYSEVLRDESGRVPIFNVIDKRSEKQKKGIIVIERSSEGVRREYYLQKDKMPGGLGVNINGEVHVLKNRIAHKVLSRVTFADGRIRMEEQGKKRGIGGVREGGERRLAAEEQEEEIGSADGRTKERPRSYEVYPKTERSEMVEVWSREEETSRTEITTRIVNIKNTITYILTIKGKSIENGIEKSVSVVAVSEHVTTRLLLQTLAKYNAYVATGLKEVVTGPGEPKEEENSFAKEAQIGKPLLECRSLYFDLVYYILLERRVILISKHPAAVLNYAQGLLVSIQPYAWNGVLCVPLPIKKEYTRLLEATVPYIMGVCGAHAETKDVIKKVPEKTVIAYLDEDRVVIAGKSAGRKSMVGRLYKNTDNRRSLPFYREIVKSIEFEWPILKTEMNILMEVICTERSIAREKVIREKVRRGEKEALRSFVNNLRDYSAETLGYLQKHAKFFQEFLGTSFCCTKWSEDAGKDGREDVLNEKQMAIVLWVSFYASCEVAKGIGGRKERIEDLKFVIEAYLKEFLESSFVAAEMLASNLFSICSLLDDYDLVMYVCHVLSKGGVWPTQDMCSALVAALPKEELHRISKETRWAGSRGGGDDGGVGNRDDDRGDRGDHDDRNGLIAIIGNKIPNGIINDIPNGARNGNGNLVNQETDSVTHNIHHNTEGEKEDLGSLQVDVREIWRKLPFVGKDARKTLLSYVCVTKEEIEQKSPGLLKALLALFDRYDLPHT